MEWRDSLYTESTPVRVAEGDPWVAAQHPTRSSAELGDPAAAAWLKSA